MSRTNSTFGTGLRRTLWAAAAGLLALLPSPALAQYSFYKAITIDRGQIADGSCGATLTNFPMLFSTVDADLAHTTFGGDVTDLQGDDIVFRAHDSTTCGGAFSCTLDHEIESYDDTSGALVAWVRLPSVNTSATGSDTVIYVYYGNSAVTTPTENPTGVWNTDYRGVWHLQEGTGVTAADSTSNANGAVPNTNDPVSGTGKIANALDFGNTFGSDRRLRIPFDASLDLRSSVTPDWTMSAWVMPTSWASSWPTIYAYGSYRASMGLSQIVAGTNGRIENWTDDTQVLNSTSAVALGEWRYVTVTRTATTTTFYFDGAADGAFATPADTTLPNQVSGIGSDGNAGMDSTEQFLGFIDEVRLSGTARSACWINAEYNNQAWPDKAVTPSPNPSPNPSVGFYSIGAETLGPYQDGKAVTVVRSRIPGTCGATLADYPMLFSVTDPDLAGTGSGGLVTDAQGDDIIFRAFDDATCGGVGLAPCTLDHEIERYVSATGQLVAWVRIPSVNTAAAASDTVIYYYYGNSAVTTPTENPAGVWASDYAGVWHLHDDLLDSTSNGNDGVATGTTNASPARIADGQAFDGVSDYIQTPSTDLQAPSTFTVSTWFRVASTATAQHLIWEGAGTNNGWGELLSMQPPPADEMHISIGDILPGTTGVTPDYVSFFLGDTDGGSNGTPDVLSARAPFTDTTSWHQVTAVVSNLGTSPQVDFYLDGALVMTDTGTTTRTPRGGWDTALRFGRPGQAVRHLNGSLDEVRISTAGRSSCQIAAEYDNFTDPGDIGYAGHYVIGAAVTAVELASFSAEPRHEAVVLSWETASETDNLGFHLYRGATPEGPWERLTETLIPGLGSSAEGARYGYVDRGLVDGTAYHYLLEDVETTGATEVHGPVWATPSASAGAADPEDPGDTDPTADAESWIRYGDPEASALRIVPRGPGRVVLELTTGGFYALPQPDGRVRLRVPGFDPLDEAGAPDLPVRRAWIDAVAGRAVEVHGVRVRDVESFEALRPAEAGVPELRVGADGIARAGRRPARPRSAKSRFRTGDGLFPETPATILETGFQGELKKALVELSPLRWDGVAGQLLLARRLEVTVSFAGVEPSERSLGGGRGRKARGGSGRPVDEARVVAFLEAPGAGPHGVAFEDVFPGQRRAVSTSALRLSRRGVDVPFHVAPDPRRFGPGSTLLFVSTGHADNPDTAAAVFALEAGVTGTLMDVRDARPAGATLATGRVRRAYETDLMYLSGLLEAPDPWLWTTIIAPRPRSFPFDLDRVGPGAAGRLLVDLVGASDTPEDPDHHVTFSVNGVLLADVHFDGKRPFSLDAAIPAGVLLDGRNVLEIHDRGDTGASVSAVYLDRFAVEYDRDLLAEQGALEASFDAAGQALLAGLGSDALLFDTTDPATPLHLAGASGSATGLAVRVEAGRRLLAVSPAAVGRPAVRAARDVSALRDTRTAWDYVVVGPRDLIDAAQPLLQWRRDHGLAVLEAPVQDVYDAFAGGEPHTDAIRDFLSFAFHQWPAPPRYVLLLGDASYDGKGRRFAHRNHVPPFMIRTPYMWSPSDAAYAAVNGDDRLPDLAIGRLPAANVEEARSLALKLVARERDGYRFDDGTALLVADDDDAAGAFTTDALHVSQTLLAGRDVELLRIDQLGGATRTAIRDAFDRGAGLASYFGHGAITTWASENVFNIADVPQLAPQPRQPFLLTMNCLNGYIVHPVLDSLAEAFLKRPDAGAAAAFAPSSLSIHTAARRYHDSLVEQVLSGRHDTLGEALLAAQDEYAAQGALPDILASYLLLGDPASSLR